MVDSLSPPSRPSSCRSTRKDRSHDRPSLRAKQSLERTLSSSSLGDCRLRGAVAIVSDDTLFNWQRSGRLHNLFATPQPCFPLGTPPRCLIVLKLKLWGMLLRGQRWPKSRLRGRLSRRDQRLDQRPGPKAGLPVPGSQSSKSRHHLRCHRYRRVQERGCGRKAGTTRA
jgi:hypothetical protein